MWFTDRPCDYAREKWYYILAFVVQVSNLSLIVRQAFGVEEITMLVIVIGTIIVVGVLYVAITAIARMITDGCFTVNEWWLLLSVIAHLATLIINELTFETASPIMAVPFFFLYPSIAINAKDRDGAVAAIASSIVVLVVVLLAYLAAIQSDWWRGAYGVTFYGDFWNRLYIFLVAGFVTAGTVYLFVSLLPLGINGFKLPGYYAWRFRDTALITIAIYVAVLYILIYGGLLRAIINAGYRSFGID